MLNSLEETVTIVEDSLSWGGTIQWAFPFNRVPPMGDSAVCLPWDKNIGVTPLGQKVVYGELNKIYKRVQRYPSTSIPPGTDIENPWGTLIKGDQWSRSFYLSNYSC